MLVALFVLDSRLPSVVLGPLVIIPVLLIALVSNAVFAFAAALVAAVVFGANPPLLLHLLPENALVLFITYSTGILLLVMARSLSAQSATLMSEQRAAKIVHDHLFAQPVPVSNDWVTDVVHVPMNDLGGDYYMIRNRGRGLAVFVGDVSGKGLGAAMLLAALKSIVSSLAEDIRPAAGLSSINQRFGRICSDDTFCTGWYGTFASDGMVVYASAGHEPAFCRQTDGTISPLDVGGLPLGVESDPTFAEQRIALRPGEEILIYSDGFTELLDRRVLKLGEVFSRFGEPIENTVSALTRRDDVLLIKVRYDPLAPRGSHDAQRGARPQADLVK